jgi:EAL domain-containing protein (putative c-di-GMP-specific phosphodiesterase class I)
MQLRNQNIAQVIINAIAASGLAPRRLELEITESVLMQNSEATLNSLHQWREIGVRIAMDDFGTGYSSLSYLRSFPFDKIKIDRSFIQDLLLTDDALKIVRAIVNLAQALGMSVTAEGVEDARQLELLRATGCTEIQGYILGAARPLGEMAQLVMPQAESVVFAA